MQTQINFDIAKITDFEDASAPFILYNSTRVASVVRKFNDKVEKGQVPALPRWTRLTAPSWTTERSGRFSWVVLPFASMIVDGAMPKLPEPPALPSYGTHKVCDFLNGMVRGLSAYYGPAGVRILPTDSQLEEVERRRRDARAYPPVQGVQAGHR